MIRLIDANSQKASKLRQFIDNRLSWDLESGFTDSLPKQKDSPIFILCPARSGSTLLRVMLAGSPDLFAPPELELLSFTNLKNRKEGLSVRLEYMLDGLVRAVMALKDCSAEEARSLLQQYEDQKTGTSAFYAELQQWCGIRRLVDKSVHYAMSTKILERAEQYFENAQYIHLSRHLYGTIHSIESLRMDKDLYGPITGYSPRELAEYTWQICHENTLDFLQNIPQERRIHVRFEDLVTAPEVSMRELCDFLKIPFHEAMLKPYEDKQKRMTDEAAGSVMVGDPRFHQRKKIEARAAESWKKEFAGGELNKSSRSIAGHLRYWDVGFVKTIEPGWLQKSNLSPREWQVWFNRLQWGSADQLSTVSRRFELPAGVQVSVFCEAFDKIVRESEPLRSIYLEERGFPQRRVLPGFETTTEIWESAQSLDILDDRFVISPLDIGRKCFNSLLAKGEKGHWVWYLKVHEMIGGKEHLQWLINRLGEVYRDLISGGTPAVSSFCIDQDASEKGKEYLVNGAYEAGAQFWQEQGISDALHWYGKAKKGNTTHTQRHAVEVADELFQLLDNPDGFAANTGRETLLATALAVFFSQVTDATQIGIGLPASQNGLLPLAIKLEKEQSIRSLHEQVCRNYQEALSHQHHPFLNAADQPLYQAVIRYESSDPLMLDGEPLHSEILNTGHRAEVVTLNIKESTFTDRISFELECNRELFSNEFLELAAGHLSQALRKVLTSADLPVEQASLLTRRETDLLESWNNTQADYPKDKTIVDLFEEQVEKTPDNIAVVFEDRELTYRELNEKANQVGCYLRETYAIEPDDIIALQLERSEWMIIAILGVMKSGAAYLPIAPDFPSVRIKYMLKDSRARALLVDTASYETTERQEIVLPVLNVESIKANKAGNPVRITSSEHLAYIIYTSGSTGQPKGTMLEHRGPVNMSMSQINQFGITSNDRILQFANYTFDAAVSELQMALFSGATLVLAAKEVITDPHSFLELIVKHQISVLTLPPVFLASLDRQGLANVRVLITAGEKPVPKDVEYYNKQLRYFNAFGPTECSVCISTYEVPESVPLPVPIGKPVENIQLYILNANNELQAIGLVGELCVSGIGLARGYLNNAELTAEKFIPHPFKPGERLYKTGDLARWLPDGNIEFLGRKDHQLKIRGYRIEAGEIEQVLLQHPAIQSAVVMGKDMEQGKELLAYLVKGEHDLPDVESLRQYLSEHLPHYMIPSYFVELEAMPLTTSGKVNRKALPEPDMSGLVAGTQYVAPRNSTESALVEIWEEVLQRSGIGIYDNFFDLGGHSLRAIQLCARITKELGVSVPLNLLFKAPNVAALADKINMHREYHHEQGIIYHPGAGQTIFAFPLFFGLAVSYHALAAQFPETTWYCFDFLETDNRLALYYEQIKKHQPEGPYVFFGYSAGGSLAFEMARFMESKGEVVSDLIFGDTVVRLEKADFDFKEYADDVIAHGEESVWGKLRSVLLQNEIIRKQTESRITTYHHFLNDLSMEEATQANIHQLEAGIIDEAKDSPAITRDWSPYTSGKFTVYSAQGDHGVLFEPPNLEVNAKIIRKIIRTIYKDGNQLTSGNGEKGRSNLYQEDEIEQLIQKNRELYVQLLKLQQEREWMNS